MASSDSPEPCSPVSAVPAAPDEELVRVVVVEEVVEVGDEGGGAAVDAERDGLKFMEANVGVARDEAVKDERFERENDEVDDVAVVDEDVVCSMAIDLSIIIVIG